MAKLVIAGIVSLTFLTLALYKSFLTFLLHNLVYLNQQEQVLIYLLYFSNCLNYLVHLSISNLSTSDFKLAKSTFLANFYESTPAAFFKSTFVA